MNAPKKHLLTTASVLGLCLSSLHAESIPLLLDFGPTTPTLGNLTNSPYHAAGGSASFNTWNVLGTADSSSLSWGNGTAATGVTLDLGVSPNNTVINFANQPGTSNALGTQVNTGVFDGNSVGKDGIFSGSNLQLNAIGLKIGGLALNTTYNVYVVGINTNASAADAGGRAALAQNIGALATGNVATLDVDSLGKQSILNHDNDNHSPTAAFYNTWSAGGNYVMTTVTLTAENPYLTIFTHGNNNRGFLNAVQVVAIPEPGTLVLVGIALGGLLIFRRRK